MWKRGFNGRPIKGTDSPLLSPHILQYLVSVEIFDVALACYEERCIFNHNWHLLVDFDFTR
jgi:hypothetical protein